MYTEDPIPYISGIALNQAQVDAMARISLSEEEISRSRTTHCALIDQMERDKQKLTLVPFNHKGECHYLLVAIVIPSFDGTDPKMRVPKYIFDSFRKSYGRGPNHEFDRLAGATFRWPICFAEPDWLYARMRETECYWRHCYEQKETQPKADMQAVGATVAAMEGVESSKV